MYKIWAVETNLDSSECIIPLRPRSFAKETPNSLVMNPHSIVVKNNYIKALSNSKLNPIFAKKLFPASLAAIKWIKIIIKSRNHPG
jgi:hypothetical protein